ncbi:hypothetical protein LWI29_005616 [Acer saccharum]|uniref:Uncharacterized protein n=1 Tax=Acer saccharum TaxID=4024 RepID=A0AA39STX8_ACESA|nr:hypothetical protein LWI29_005616 [Acer saccharum]
MNPLLPIPECAANPEQVEVSSDKKKKGFIWGFPTSNKRWKNNWFFVGGAWGRDVPARARHNLSAGRVPKHFTSPDSWSKAIPTLLDDEISHLAAIAVLPLDEGGRSFLLDEEKMITQRIFPRLPTRLPRMCDFETVYDLQAWAAKISEAASKRHAAGLAKKGIASPDSGDHSDGEDVGDGPREGVESGELPLHREVAGSTHSRKGKEKVGASGVPAEEVTAAVPPLNERTNEPDVPVSALPRLAPPPAATDEPNTSSTGRLGPASQLGPSTQMGAPVSASCSSVAREAPPVGSTEAGEGSHYVSLSDFSATEMCSYLLHHNVYIGEGWEHMKDKSCNSIRNHNRACSSPNTKIRKHTNTKIHTYASFRT